MLHVLFLILKIIGIILLVILGLIVLLLCVVLFVPLRYRLNGSGAGDIKSLQGRVKFSWLLHLVGGFAQYQDGQLQWQVRVAWLKLNKEAETVTEPEVKAEEKPEEKSLAELEKELDEMEEPAPTEKESQIEESLLEKKNETVEIVQDKKEKVSFLTKIKTIYEKIKYTFQRICDNIKSLLRTKDKLEDFVSDEVHQAAFARGVKELKRFLKFLKPKKFHLNAHYGFEDPSLTGKVLAGLSVLYPFVGKNHLCVTPEFEDEIYEGDVMIAGHFRVVYVIIVGLHLLLDKNIRMTYKHIKNFKK